MRASCDIVRYSAVQCGQYIYSKFYVQTVCRGLQPGLVFALRVFVLWLYGVCWPALGLPAADGAIEELQKPGLGLHPEVWLCIICANGLVVGVTVLSALGRVLSPEGA